MLIMNEGRKVPENVRSRSCACVCGAAFERERERLHRLDQYSQRSLLKRIFSIIFGRGDGVWSQ